ncbi:nuclear transport factor 2 family protein [Poseidonibacter sp.]|uniref:nuclear transport factor 2 family protein n=1 Tax=Poseidonibacter sp. TaxID=2321188 RepID=UPI003C72DF4A
MKALVYGSFFESINENTPKIDYERVLDKNARFKDPFHDVNGLDNIYNIFQDMYKKLDNPRFKIIEIIEENNIAYIKWDFIFNFKNSLKEESFQGVSRIEFNNDRKVISHIDYWDSAENLYEKIPLLGSFMRFIKKIIKA